MNEDEELKTLGGSLFAELITNEDSRYEEERGRYPEDMSEEEPVLPVIEPTRKRELGPPIVINVIDQLEEYLDDNPDIMHNIVTCEEDNVLESYPVGKPHTEEFRICNFNISKIEDDVSIVSEFDFEEIMSICSD